MGIVLFAVCTVFGVAAVVLWAALSSARLKLVQAKQLTDSMQQAIDRGVPLTDTERAALAAQRAAVYGDS